MANANVQAALTALNSGDAANLRALLDEDPSLVQQVIPFEGFDYFRNPTLLEFIAENPIRTGKLPANIVELARIILDAKPDRAAIDRTLTLVATGRIPREHGVQTELISLLISRGADPNQAVLITATHGEFQAVLALLKDGARMTLPIAAALGDFTQADALLGAGDKQAALALAAQFGHTGIVSLLLDAGADPNQFNPPGTHAHSTPLHQAALNGHLETVRLLLSRGANPDIPDRIWNGTAAGWAKHAGHDAVYGLLTASCR